MTDNGPYTISLSLNPSGTISGTTSGQTANGNLTLSSLKITTAGTYILTASCQGFNSTSSSSFTVSDVYVISLSISMSNSSISAYFSYQTTVELKIADGSYFTQSVAVSISCTGMNSYSPVDNTNGIVVFNAYFTMSGDWTITASVPASGTNQGVTQTLGITVLAPVLAITSFSPVNYI